MLHVLLFSSALLYHIFFVSCWPTCLFGPVIENDRPIFFSYGIFPDFSLGVNPARDITFEDFFSALDGLAYTYNLVLGLSIIVLITAAFFVGVAGSAAFTTSVLRFLKVLFLNPSPGGFSSSGFCWRCFRSRCFLTHSLICSLIFALLTCSLARGSSLTFFAHVFCAISLMERLVCLR